MTALIDIKELEKSRRDQERIFRLKVPGFSLERGARIALVGPSGSGKSTFIDLLALALKPDGYRSFSLTPHSGEQQLDLGKLWSSDRAITNARARYFGYVQQAGGLLGFLSVRGNIGLGLTLAGLKAPGRIEGLSERLGISDLLDAKPASLSVGQRQRVTIARALVHNPAVVLADEPTASLDLDNAENVMGLLCETSQEMGVALVLATHNPALAQQFDFRFCNAEIEHDTVGQITSFRIEG